MEEAAETEKAEGLEERRQLNHEDRHVGAEMFGECGRKEKWEGKNKKGKHRQKFDTMSGWGGHHNLI